MVALANGKVSNKPNKHRKNPKKIQNSWISESNLRLTRNQEDIEEYGSLESAVHGSIVDVENVCIKTFSIKFKCLLDKTLIEFVPLLDSGRCHELSLQGYRNHVKACTTLLEAKFPSLHCLQNDFGRGDMLIAFRTNVYVQANIFLSAPIRPQG